MKWLITYKAFENKKWSKFKKIVVADSKQQAITKADLWPPLIIKVEKA